MFVLSSSICMTCLLCVFVLSWERDIPDFSDSGIICCSLLQMSDRGSGSGGQRRSSRLAKGKSIAYAPESSPDTDDEFDAMEDVRTRADAAIARNLQAELDAEAAGIVGGASRPPLGPGITLGRGARPSGAPHRPAGTQVGALPARSKRQRTNRAPLFADPVLEDYAAPGFRYPPRGGIRPRHPVTTPVGDTPLLTGLLKHPSSLVRRCEVCVY